MDAIVIRDLRVEALIGIHRRERHVMQTLSIDLDIGLPGSAVFASDKVADTIDYEQVALRIRELAGAQHYRLVETFADRFAPHRRLWRAMGEGERREDRHPSQRQVRRRHPRARQALAAGMVLGVEML